MEQNAFARLDGRDFEFLMTKRRIVIGRNSKLGSVDVNMGATRFISRKHLEIMMDGSKFYLLCRGKNGVFVNNVFQKREAKRLHLPYSCIIRFPSTQIKLAFSSLLEENGGDTPNSIARPSSPLPPSSAFQSPYVTPVPSPTGTISAYNSCPASPGGTIGSHSTRLPSFDLMARYASKLLSQQNEGRVTPESDKGDQLSIKEEVVDEVVEAEGDPPSNHTHPQSTESSGASSPTEGQQQEQEEGDQRSSNGNADRETGNGATDEAADEDGMPFPNPDERIGKDGKKYTKPPYSYAQLIVQALLASSDRRQTLNSIYQFISNRYPFYRLEEKGWKNSIRHNLSLNQYFMKAAREREGLGFGKGGYWCMHPDYEEKLTSQAHVKRKKKGIPVFPSAGLMSKSAPPSPTHNPFIHDIKDCDTTYRTSTSAVSAHPFTLPPFIPQLVGASSHSLPPSPSRLPINTAFPAAPTQGIRFFTPLQVRSTSTDALTIDNRRPRIEDTNGADQLSKKPRYSPNDAESSVKPALSQSKNIIIRSPQPSILATQPGLPPQCFPLAQTAPIRFPFAVGMPVYPQHVVSQAFSPTPIAAPVPVPVVTEIKEEEREVSTD